MFVEEIEIFDQTSLIYAINKRQDYSKENNSGGGSYATFDHFYGLLAASAHRVITPSVRSNSAFQILQELYTCHGGIYSWLILFQLSPRFRNTLESVWKSIKFPLTPMGVLAHRLRTLDRSLVPPSA